MGFSSSDLRAEHSGGLRLLSRPLASVHAMPLAAFVLCGALLLMPPAGIAQEGSVPLSGGKLTLAQCIDLSLKNNLSVLNSAENVNAARANLWSARSNLLPSLSVGMNYSRRTSGPSQYSRIDFQTGQVIRGLSGVTVNQFYGSSISLSQPIYNRSAWAALAQRGASVDAAEYSLEDTKQRLVLEVRQDYYNLLKAEKVLKVRQATVRRSQEHVRDAESRFKVGLSTLADVLKAKVQLGTDRLNLITAENSLANARAQLSYSLGLDVAAPIDVVDDMAVPETQAGLETSLRQALQIHPSVQRANTQLESAEAGVTSAQASRWPRISLSSGYSWNDDNLSAMKNMFNRDYSWSVGVGVSFTVFDGFGTRAATQAAKANLRAAKNSLEQEKRDVALAVRRAFLALQEARARIAVSAENVAAGEQDLKLAEERYRLGAGTMLELIDAQVALSQAEISHVEAIYSYKTAQAQFEQAAGTPVAD